MKIGIKTSMKLRRCLFALPDLITLTSNGDVGLLRILVSNSFLIDLPTYSTSQTDKLVNEIADWSVYGTAGIVTLTKSGEFKSSFIRGTIISFEKPEDIVAFNLMFCGTPTGENGRV